jgi:hypothetical protein
VSGIDPYWAGTLRFKIITRITMAATLAAVVLLVSAMLFFADEKGMDYFSLVQFRAVTHDNLPELLTIAGLFLVVCICAVSWVLALYGSFRVAGPLYRLARNLELAPVSPKLLGVRKGDCFQDVSQQLQQAVDRMHEHYALVGQQLNSIEGMFASGRGQLDELDMVIARVKEDIHRVRLD